MRPVLHPALSRTWRDPSTLQIGVTPGLALVLGGLGRVETTILEAMNGEYEVQALRELAVESGGHRSTADRLIEVLLSAGAAVDRDQLPEHVPASERGRADRSSVGLQHGSPDGGIAPLEARGRLRVDVYGADRVGSQIARLLAAAGIGEVVVTDPAPVSAADVCPGGLGPDAVGRPRGRALDRMLRTDAVAAGSSVESGPHFAVLAPTAGTGRDEAAELLRLAVPHLFVQVVELTGVVGPLVVPGESSCLRCHDLHRTDRDRHWPLVLDQSMRRPPPEPACDTGLATAVAGLAAVQVLSHLDGFAAAAVDGTIEVSLPHGLPRRRSWSRHPGCGCGWDRAEAEAAQWVP